MKARTRTDSKPVKPALDAVNFTLGSYPTSQNRFIVGNAVSGQHKLNMNLYKPSLAIIDCGLE